VSGNAAAPPSGAAFLAVIDRLEHHGCRVTGSGYQRAAQCPAHDDSTPSLMIKQGNLGALVYCHGHCPTDDVLAALGMTRADLFDEPAERSVSPDDWAPWQSEDHSSPCPCAPVARYSYTDEVGELLFQVVRGAHKEISQRRPDSASRSGWRWSGVNAVRHVVYRLPAVLAAPASALILVAEGEKDVHALEAAGVIATCSPGGAGKWRPEYAEPFAGRDVLIIADRDQPNKHTGLRAGADHAWDAYTSVQPVARFAWIAQAAVGKDAADHLAAGRDITEFVWWNL
jgi:hypothetical protein